MNTKILSILSVLLLSPLFFVSANTMNKDIDISFKGTNMIFKTDASCRSDLSYTSKDGNVKVDLKESSFRQSHKIQLWNLDFTTFDYNLKLTDSEGNVTLKEGSFTVVPADPTLIKKTEDTQKSLNEMTREELISLLDKLLKK
jgi:hypothetical protein